MYIDRGLLQNKINEYKSLANSKNAIEELENICKAEALVDLLEECKPRFTEDISFEFIKIMNKIEDSEYFGTHVTKSGDKWVPLQVMNIGLSLALEKLEAKCTTSEHKE